jgi:hypothetical protein
LIGFTVITIPIISGAPPICSATVLPNRWQYRWHRVGDRYRQSRNLLKLLVVGAVTIEPVSTGQFPANSLS